MKYNLSVIGKQTALRIIRDVKKLASKTGELVRLTQANMVTHEMTIRSAALAYQGLLSMFPLLLFLIFIGGNVLASDSTRTALDSVLVEVFPGNINQVTQILDQVIQARTSLGLVSGIGLLWSASTIFSILESSLNVIWGAKPRSFWRRRLIGALAVLLICLVFLVAVTIWPLITWLWSGREALFLRLLSLFLDFVMMTLLAWLIYRILPNRIIDLRASLLGALLASFFWQIARSLFGWYLNVAFVNLGFVYGSLAWLVVLAIWGYLTSYILFLGAEFGTVLEKEFC